jgi:hypothetical protein
MPHSTVRRGWCPRLIPHSGTMSQWNERPLLPGGCASVVLDVEGVDDRREADLVSMLVNVENKSYSSGVHTTST